MSTVRYVVYNILEGLQSVFPDAQIEEAQVWYWYATTANLIRKRHLQTTQTGAYLTRFSNVPVLIDPYAKRKYIELPAPIYDLVFEKGIEYISYDSATNPHTFAQTFFQMVRAAEAFRLNYSPYEQPTPKNPYGYRVNERVYFLGVEAITLKSVEVAIYSAIDPRYTQQVLDNETGLNPEQEADVMKEVLNIGRWVLSVPSYRLETGDDGRPSGAAQQLKQSQPEEQPEQ